MSKLEPCRWGPEITQDELDGLVDIVCLAASGTQCCAAFICPASYEYRSSTQCTTIESFVGEVLVSAARSESCS
jgi:hypothetical protein